MQKNFCNFAANFCKHIKNLTYNESNKTYCNLRIKHRRSCDGLFCVTSVTTPIKFENTRAEREVVVIKHLVDLRTAEVEYHHQNGRFTANYDSLLLFLKTAPKKEVLKEGSLTDKQLEAGLTEHKAVKILNEAKKKALKKNQFEDNDALYAYIWENDADVIKNGLAGFPS